MQSQLLAVVCTYFSLLSSNTSIISRAWGRFLEGGHIRTSATMSVPAEPAQAKAFILQLFSLRVADYSIRDGLFDLFSISILE